MTVSAPVLRTMPSPRSSTDDAAAWSATKTASGASATAVAGQDAGGGVPRHFWLSQSETAIRSAAVRAFVKRSASQTYSPPARSPPPPLVQSGMPRITITPFLSSYGSFVPSVFVSCMSRSL